MKYVFSEVTGLSSGLNILVFFIFDQNLVWVCSRARLFCMPALSLGLETLFPYLPETF